METNNQPYTKPHQGPADSESSTKEVVLITGSSGLIGTAIINQLANRYHLIGLDIKPFSSSMPADYIEMDITSEESIRQALDKVQSSFGKRIASVIHLAAYYDFEGKESPLYEKITVRGTENLLKALQRFEVEQFIFSSSMLVYKPSSPGEKMDENWPLQAKWEYPQSKIDTEKIIHFERGTIPVVLLRIAGVYSEEGHSIPITNQIQRIFERQLTSHFYPGDTSAGNTYIHLDDLVDSFVACVEKRKQLPPETVLNIGEPEAVSYEELQDTIGELVHGEEWRTFEIPKPIAKAGAAVQDLFGDPFIKPWMVDLATDHYELDITQAKQLVGWEPKHSLKATLLEMISKLKADPLAWYKKNKLDPPSDLEQNENRSQGKEG